MFEDGSTTRGDTVAAASGTRHAKLLTSDAKAAINLPGLTCAGAMRKPAKEHNWALNGRRTSCMSVAYAYERRTVLASGALLLLSLSLGGCATSAVVSSPMDARAEIPVTPESKVYLPVGVVPPDRETAVLTPDERSKLKKELIAARDRQAAAAKAQGADLANPKSADLTFH
jgi:hypothetical protein